MAEKPKVVFRVDANSRIGSGHLVRCGIIAERLMELQECSITFLTKDLPENFRTDIQAKGFQVVAMTANSDKEDLKEQLNAMQSADLLIVDSDIDFYYTEEYQQSIRETGVKLVMITFYNKTHFYADLIHNQNIRAPFLEYSTEPYTKKLLGLKYVILKRRFRELASGHEVKLKQTPGKLTVLLSFGGSDSRNFTGAVYKLLRNKSDELNKIIIVLGAMYFSKSQVEELQQSASVPTEIYQNTDIMPDLMAQCQIGITSGGLTMWELAALNVQNIIIPTSPREEITSDFLKKNDYAFVIDEPDQIEKTLPILIADLFQNPEKRKSKLHHEINVNGVDDFCNACFSLITQ